MLLRSFPARWALAGLLAAICLPFLAVAKPPDLPNNPKVECKPQVVETSTGVVLAGLGVSSDVAEDFVGTFCPGIGDTLESCWRTLTRWLPVTCTPDCCVEPTTRLAAIEVLPVMPKIVEQCLSEVLNTSDEFMCLIPDNWERMLPADDGCKSCCQQAAPRQLVVTECTDLSCCLLENLAKLEKAHCLVEKAKRCCREGKLVEACHCYAEAAKLCPGSRYSMQCRAWMHEMMTQCESGGVIQASATEPAAGTAQRSGWPRIEIKLTIEVKKQ